MINLLLVDNYDSFTFNLKDILSAQEGICLDVCRNDEDFLSNVKAGKYDGAVIGPGPGSPEEEKYFGNNKKLILDYGRRGLPILGVCLGFQGIYHCFGGRLRLGDQPVHGKVSQLAIVKPSCILDSIPERASVMRYHSIVADTSEPIPSELIVTSYAYAADEESVDFNAPMSLEHKDFPIYGVQFHPESFATKTGHIMIKNFSKKCLDLLHK